MAGIVLMPRQNQMEHEGEIRGYSVEASGDGVQWREVARGELVSTFAPQSVRFVPTLTTRHLKFIALSGFGNGSTAALAEIAVVYAGPSLDRSRAPKPEHRRVPSVTEDVDEGALLNSP